MNQDYKEFAIHLARKAGKIMRENFTLGMEKEWKKDNTPLTVTDKAINDMVIEAVRENYPMHSILSEEGSHNVKDSEYTWVCDPVDGTIPFSHGIPTSMFSLALTHKGESIIGVLYDPALDRLFSAVKGDGAHMNEQKIKVLDTNILKNTVADSTWFANSKYDIHTLSYLLEKAQAIPLCLMCVGYSGAMVAKGEFSAVVFAGSTAWDGAAVKIIVEEAGGKVTNLFGEEQRYDQDIKGFIASNRLIHDQLVGLVSLSLRSTS